MNKRDLVSIKDLSPEGINGLFALTDELKKKGTQFGEPLAGKTLALIFQKPSNRTRVSFEVGMTQLGGHAIYLGPYELNLGVREAVKDAALVLSRYVDAIAARVYSHKDILGLARFATIPVINALSDLSHPCQGLTDIYTIKEKFGRLDRVNFAYVGDGNNVLNSLIYATSKLGMSFSIATPKAYAPNKEVIKYALETAPKTGAKIFLSNEPHMVARGADVIYTDVWASMGKEKELTKRRKAFKPFQVNMKLLKEASRNCLIMHCLPAHRGEEITDEVLDGPNSIVYDQAENRLHVQKAILLELLGGK